jgi:hypothetical protein
MRNMLDETSNFSQNFVSGLTGMYKMECIKKSNKGFADVMFYVMSKAMRVIDNNQKIPAQFGINIDGTIFRGSADWLLTRDGRRWLGIERNRSIALLPHEGLHSVQYEAGASLLFDRLHRALVLRSGGFLAARWTS